MRADLAELDLGEVKVAVLLPTQPVVSSQGCVAPSGLLGLAISAQSSLHFVTEVALRGSEPRLLLDTFPQAQDIAALSFGSFVIYTCLFSLYSLDLCTQRQFFQSHQTKLESGQWHVYKQYGGHLKRWIPSWLPPFSIAMISPALNDRVQKNGDSSALDA